MTVTIKLESPVEIGEKLVEEIKLRRPKGKDLKSLPGNPTMGDYQKLASKLSGELPAVFDEMDSYDLTQVLEAVGNFFSSGPATGN